MQAPTTNMTTSGPGGGVLFEVAREAASSAAEVVSSTGVPLSTSDAPGVLPTAFKRKHSVGDRAAHIPIVQLLSLILLFVALSIFTAVLLNWFLRRRQRLADERSDGAQEEEMTLTGNQRGATAVPVGDKPQSSSMLTSSSASGTASGSSSRQRFLEGRRAAAQRTYGATDGTKETE